MQKPTRCGSCNNCGQKTDQVFCSPACQKEYVDAADAEFLEDLMEARRHQDEPSPTGQP